MKIEKFEITYNNKTYQNVKVPFSLCSVMIENGEIKHPYYDGSEDVAAEICKKGFTAKASFIVEREEKKKEFSLLEIQKIDTYAKLYLNGILLDETDNYHRLFRFNVKGLLKEGKNELAIVFCPAIPEREKFLKKYSLYANGDKRNASRYIHSVRKPLYMLGWDWSPCIDDMGLYATPTITCFNHGRIKDFFVAQRMGENKVDIDVVAEIESRTLYVDNAENLDVYYEIITPDGESLRSENGRFTVFKPKLWWPNGYGEQPLYTVKAKLFYNGSQIDEKEKNIGIRTIELVDEDLPDRSNCYFKVNGVRIVALGANYVPQESILAYETEEKQRGLVRTMKCSNFNSVRVWGGGEYGSDEFYDECDKQGILVWQDFMFACNMHLLTDRILHTQREEIKYQIKRLRSHASLGVFCGNNEIAAMAYDWLKNNTVDYGARYSYEYFRLYCIEIPALLKKYAPQVSYREASPCAGPEFKNMPMYFCKTENENYGDRHFWKVWHRLGDYRELGEHRFPFLSEFGFASLPEKNSIDKFDDGANGYKKLKAHIKTKKIKENYKKFIETAFKNLKSIDDYVYATQVYQARIVKCATDNIRSHRKDCNGLYVWQLNDCWPTLSFSTIDYENKWKCAQFVMKRNFESVFLHMAFIEDEVALKAVNDFRNIFNGTLVLQIVNNDLTVLQYSEIELKIAPLSEQRLTVACPQYKKNGTVAYCYLKKDGEISNRNALKFVSDEKYMFSHPTFKKTVVAKNGKKYFILKSNVFTQETYLYSANDGITFSDNCFDICEKSGYMIEIFGADGLTDKEICDAVCVNCYNNYSKSCCGEVKNETGFRK